MISIQPQRGIKSGGTILKIVGKHLSCGSTLEFQMSSSYCSILNISTANHDYMNMNENDVVYCITPPASASTGNHGVHRLNNRFSFIKMKMDDYTVLLDDEKFKFEYVNDPKVLAIEPDRTIVSGGLVMTIKGQDFDNVQMASIVLVSPLGSTQQMDQVYTNDLQSRINSTNSLNSFFKQVHFIFFLYFI